MRSLLEDTSKEPLHMSSINTKTSKWRIAEVPEQDVWPRGKEIDVLRILKDEPQGAPGLTIVAKSEGRVGRSSVYVLLGRLEEKGFVKVKEVASALSTFPKPMYFITDAGQKKLEAIEMGHGAHIYI